MIYNGFLNRVAQLESGTKPLYLAKYYKVDDGGNYICAPFVGCYPYVLWTHYFNHLTGSDATGFYNAYNDWSVFLGLVGGIIATHWALGGAIIMAIALALFVEEVAIQYYSPSGEAYIGYWANLLPVPTNGLIIGNGAWYVPTGMSVDSAQVYGDTVGWNTYGQWVQE